MRNKFILLLLVIVAVLMGKPVYSQDMGTELTSNGDGTYTLTWTSATGTNTVTTNSQGYYDASSGGYRACKLNAPSGCRDRLYEFQ